MSRIMWDGFDTYSSMTDLNQIKRWDGFNIDPGLSATTRFGTGLAFHTHLSGRNIYKNLANPSRLFLGFAIRADASVLSNNNVMMWALLDGATFQVCATYESDRTVKIRRGTYNGTVLGSATLWTGGANNWVWLEFEILLDGAAGIARCWREGTQVINATAQNTAPSGTGQATQFRFGQADVSAGSDQFGQDDFYLNDDAGAAPFNGRLGDSRVYLLKPSAAGDLTQLTPDSGSNYQRVQSIDDDSSYNATSTVGNADLYNFDDLPGAFLGVVRSVAHTTRWRKDDAGARTAAQLLKSGTTTVQGSDVALLSSYEDEVTFFDQDPDTAAGWTVSGVNALQGGAKLTA